MRYPSKTRRPGGFTLIELLVSIVIVAVLAAIGFSVAKNAVRGARAAKEVSNLRQVGQLLTAELGERGYYPVGWDAGERHSWADTLVERSTEGDETITQMELLWSPLLERDIPLTLKREAVTHFAGNPAILTEAAGDGAEDPDGPRFKIRSSMLRRPSEQILLCSALPEKQGAEYQASIPILREMQQAVGDTGGAELPLMEPDRAKEPMTFPASVNPNAETFGSAPDFFRFGKGKGQFLFVDGHIQAMAPTEHTERNWASNY